MNLGLISLLLYGGSVILGFASESLDKKKQEQLIEEEIEKRIETRLGSSDEEKEEDQ